MSNRGVAPTVKHPPPRWHRAHASPRGRLRSALSVALAAVGCAPPGPRAPEAATQALRTSLQLEVTPGRTLSYLQAGDSQGPRLILVHGTPGLAVSWADYLVAPPAGLEVLALDRPGFGQSGPVHAVPALADQAAALLALLPEPGRPVVLLGHSLGGPIVALAAAQLASQQPGRSVCLVLLAASLDPAQEKIHLLQHVGAWAPLRALLPRVIRNANAELMALKPELLALAPLLASVKGRVVIVHGTADDLVPVANVAYMQAAFTGASCVKTVLLQGHSHFLPWNSEAAVRDAIRLALDPSC